MPMTPEELRALLERVESGETPSLDDLKVAIAALEAKGSLGAAARLKGEWLSLLAKQSR